MHAKTIIVMCFLVLPVHLIAQSPVSLFNGKDLTGWDTYLGVPHESVRFEGKVDGQPLGLNNDPKGVYTVVEEDGEPAIRISGEVFGALTTRQEFENYRLSLKFKWGKKKWPPRDQAIRDSGILYHCVGKHGAGGGFWMTSQECQVQEGDCGDLWTVGKVRIDVPAKDNPAVKNNTPVGQNNFIYDAGSPLKTFGTGKGIGRCVKSPDNEKPSGEWNTIEVICWEDKSLHIVNGKVVMALSGSRRMVNGQEKPLTKGKIQIQSEGAEVFYKDIMVKAVKKMPGKFKKYFN